MHKREHEAQESRRSTSGTEDPREKSAYGILALLARELPKLLEDGPESDAGTDIRFGTEPHKRRRVENRFFPSGVKSGEGEEDVVRSPYLPSSDRLGAVLRAYFACIHPWIPMVHQARLRRRLADPVELPKLNVLLHAMVLAASRFVDDQDVVNANPSRSRGWVVSAAMDCMSVESLQALIVVAFNDVSMAMRRVCDNLLDV